MVDVNSLLTEAENTLLSGAANSVIAAAAAAAAKLGPELTAIGADLVGKVTSAVNAALTGNLTPAQYAQLELDEAADIAEETANAAPQADAPPLDPNAPPVSS